MKHIFILILFLMSFVAHSQSRPQYFDATKFRFGDSSKPFILSSELSFLSGLTSNVQSQINSLSGTSPAPTYDAVSVNGRMAPLWSWSSPEIKLNNPTTVPVGTLTGVAMSPNTRVIMVGSTVAPFVQAYERIANSFQQITAPPTTVVTTGLVNAMGTGNFSPDGRYVVTGHAGTPFIRIYEVNGNTFTNVANPAALPAGEVRNVSWSNDARFFATVHATTPFMSVYEKQGNTFVKLANPTTLPVATTPLGVEMHPDGRLIVVASDTSPNFLQSYWINSSGNLTKISNPSTQPASLCVDIEFSPDGLMLACVTMPGIIHIYSVDGLSLNWEYSVGGPGNGRSLAWHPSGNYLAVGQQSGSPLLYVYTMVGFQPTNPTAPTSSPAMTMNAVDFSIDGRFLIAVGPVSPFIHIWETGITPPSIVGKSPSVKNVFGTSPAW